MGLQLKVMLTCAVVALGVGVLLVDGKANNAGADWWWKGGKRDSIRNMICRPDGSLRRYTKVGILIWFAVWLGVVWLLG